MKRLYALLFNLTIISTHGVAKTTKNNSKLETNKKDKIVLKRVDTKLEDNNFKLADYKVKNGDTLFIIARKHHTTIAQVELVNNLAKDETLKIGQSLRVPMNTYKPKQKNNKKDINNQEINTNIIKLIKEGDTLLAIALNNGTTLTKLAKFNNFSEDKKLKLGETILIPHSEQSEKKKIKIVSKSKKSAHTIKKGDTLYKIALANNTTVAKLKKINKLNPKDNLKLGDLIYLTERKVTIKKSSKIAKIDKNKKVKKKSKKTKVVSKVKKSKKSHTKLAMQKKKSIKKVSKNINHKTKSLVNIEKKRSKKSLLELLGIGGSSLKLTSAKSQLGKRYVWGATGPYSFDCSGFTKYVCDKNGVCIPRTSIKQSKIGQRVSRKELKAGDLIFFDTSKRRRGYVNHVGIYIGNNKFIHASSAKRKVVITSLETPFYKSRFKWGSRVKG